MNGQQQQEQQQHTEDDKLFTMAPLKTTEVKTLVQLCQMNINQLRIFKYLKSE
jgi:hypothetical protein